nr:hypothetical protein [Tanacetum cinerariifolium]
MVESPKKKKLKEFDFVTKGGDHVHLTKEQIKAQKRIKESAKAEATKHEVEVRKEEFVDLHDPDAVSKQIQTRMDNLHKTKAELEIELDKPLNEQDPLEKLNDLTKKKRKNADDIHDYSEQTKGSSHQYSMKIIQLERC